MSHSKIWMSASAIALLLFASSALPQVSRDPHGLGRIPASPHPSAERRTALVIGNAAYEMGRLRNPRHDATDMANTLKQFGFNVKLLLDANQQQMEEAIHNFGEQLHQGGVGLFYYAGHGVQVRGENYLVPTDAKLRAETDVRYKAVPAGFVLERMETTVDNRLNIVILDACRNNPFARQWRRYRTQPAPSGLASMQAASVP